MTPGFPRRAFALLGAACVLLAAAPEVKPAAAAGSSAPAASAAASGAASSPVPNGASGSPGSSSSSGASASLSASPAASPSPSLATVANRFGGTWRCEGYASDDNGSETYMRESSDVIALIVRLDSGRLASERFSYDEARNLWQLSTAASAAPLVALPESDERWIFAGGEGDRARPHPVRIVYTMLGPLAFRREHQVPAGNGWVDDAETVCRRTSAPLVAAPSPSPAPPRRSPPAASGRRTMTLAIGQRTGSPSSATAPPSGSPQPAHSPGPSRSPSPARPSPSSARPSPSRSPARSSPSPSPARPSPSHSPARPWPSPAPNRDRAYHLVGGTWDCETIEGNSAPHTYTLSRDGSIDLRTVLAIDNKNFTIDERYSYERARDRWTATTVGGSYTATAGPWNGDKWIFDGIAVSDGRRIPERMIYTDLEEHAFRRDFRRVRGTAWETIASETCKRR